MENKKVLVKLLVGLFTIGALILIINAMFNSYSLSLATLSDGFIGFVSSSMLFVWFISRAAIIKSEDRLNVIAIITIIIDIVVYLLFILSYMGVLTFGLDSVQYYLIAIVMMVFLSLLCNVYRIPPKNMVTTITQHATALALICSFVIMVLMIFSGESVLFSGFSIAEGLSIKSKIYSVSSLTTILGFILIPMLDDASTFDAIRIGEEAVSLNVTHLDMPKQPLGSNEDNKIVNQQSLNSNSSSFMPASNKETQTSMPNTTPPFVPNSSDENQPAKPDDPYKW